MKSNMKKLCGKCGAIINCQENQVESCACSEVYLNQEAIIFLSKTYFDCLCNDCLNKIVADLNEFKTYILPIMKDDFVEGLHFYREGNKWVFTELYHLLKGSCCGNDCRHCVYGFQLRN
jgi:hypothetical protein